MDKILQEVIELRTDITIGIDNEISSVVDRLMQIQTSLQQLKLYSVSQQRELLKSFADWLQGEVWNDKHEYFSDYVEEYIKTL